MQVKLLDSFDPSRPTLLLFFEVAMNNRLFGHTLREVYLPFFRQLADRALLNLVYVSTKVKKIEYFAKHEPPTDGYAVITEDEEIGAPVTFQDRFDSLDLAPLRKLGPSKLVALTTPLVLRSDIKRKSFAKLMAAKQSKMESINASWLMFLGGAYLAEKLNLPLDHIIVDPLESDYHELQGFTKPGDRYFLYESKIFNARPLQIAEASYREAFAKPKSQLLDFGIERDLDLLVGYSITQKPRLWLQAYDFEALLANTGLTHRICIKDSFRDIDTFIWDKKEYLSLLQRSKFTVIIPSYEEQAFSTIRFIEALCAGTIPLILDKCVMSEAFTANEQAMLAPLKINDTNVVAVIQSIDYEAKIKELQEWFLVARPLRIDLE